MKVTSTVTVPLTYVQAITRIAELERENKKLNRCVDLAIRIFRDNGNHGYVKAMEELAGEKGNG